MISLARSLRDLLLHPTQCGIVKITATTLVLALQKREALVYVVGPPRWRRPPIFERISFHERLLKCAVKKKKEAWVLNGP